MENKQSLREKLGVPAFSDFKYWFTYAGPGRYAVWTRVGSGWDEAVGSYTRDQILEDAIWASDFQMFMRRPEHSIYISQTDESSFQGVDTRYIYDWYLIGCSLIRAGRGFKYDPDSAWTKLEQILNWLNSTDFYEAPASTQYHESIPGGLCLHTLKVVEKIKDLMRCDSFNKVRIEDAVLVALVHDWCKIGLYESYMRNVKDDNTGVWHQVPSFKTKSPRFSSFGHGVSSMFLASRFFQLSQEEALAIRWHQGRWNCCREEMNELQQSNETYPLVHLIQFADQLAIVKY